MMKIASHDHAETNIRVNEVYLGARVDYDSVAEKEGSIPSSEFGKVYEGILGREEVRGCRVSVTGKGDLGDLRFEKLLKG